MSDCTTWPTSCLTVTIAERTWTLERIADLETLWDLMDDDDDDDHIPYWVEVWPASLALAAWFESHPESLQGQRCLDLGCGLGLTALVAASLGARVTALDHTWSAVHFARKNTILNHVTPSPLWVQMDWCRPAFQPSMFDSIWGGDILYEQRFFDPLLALFRHALAPCGRIILCSPDRTVTRPVWGRLIQEGWQVKELQPANHLLQDHKAAVRLMQLTR
ncbi:MAG: methyltransferase [Deltaproteobacteria bacterium]|nr:MAG: methyltransferase [Deltaproteobacteria bacterium]